MKKHTRNLFIMTLIFTILSIAVMIIFLRPQYQGTSGFAGGFGMFFVCILHFNKLWKAHCNKGDEETLETKLGDERTTKIQVHAAYTAYMIVLGTIIFVALIALYFHYDLLTNILMVCGGVMLLIYGICYFIYKHIY